MKRETIKEFCNTMFYGCAVSLAIWKTLQVRQLKRDMKYYAETLEKVQDEIKEVDNLIDSLQYPTIYGTKAGEKDDLLTKAGYKLASMAGKIQFVKEDCASK